MTTPRRPMLPVEDRNLLRRLRDNAIKAGESGMNRAYAQGVADTMSWLIGEDMSAMFGDVTGTR